MSQTLTTWLSSVMDMTNYSLTLHLKNNNSNNKNKNKNKRYQHTP